MAPDAVYWTLSGMDPFPAAGNIAVSMMFDYACSWDGDGEYVDVNGTYIGNCGTGDYNSGACASILGNYYYENGVTFGLNNDTADGSIGEGDALWNADSFVTPGDTGMDLVMYDGPLYAGFDNGFYLGVFTYGSSCDIPPYTVSNDTLVCPGQSAQLSASGGDTYLWSPAASLDDASSPTPIAMPAATTTYEVQIDFANGCSVTQDVTVTVDTDALDFETVIIDPLCSGNGSIEVINVSGGVGLLTYSLDGVDQAGPLFDDLPPEDYTVSVTDALGCSGTSFVSVNLDTYTIDFDIAVINQMCQTPGQLEVTSINNGIGPFTFELNNLPEPDGLFESLDAANYNISITDSIGCTGTQAVYIPMDNPVITFDTEVTDVVCSTPGSVEVLNFSGTSPYTLVVDGETQPGYIADSLASGTHTLVITDANGCLGTLEVELQYIDTSMALATYNPNIGTIPLTVNFDNESIGLNDFVWSFGNGDYSNTEDAIYTYDLPGIYTVELFGYDTINGCFDSLSFEIIADIYSLYIPNAFTPDGDGINDYFMPSGSGVDPDNYFLQIFDRWGSPVFETQEIDNPWIGNNRNGEYFVETGVYVYRLQYRFFDSIELLETTGHVTLVR
jgi:gliding motility-associated-like protein